MPRPACVPCRTFMRPEKNDFCIEAEGEALWFCDLWKCPRCGQEITTGYGKKPIAETHQPQYDTIHEAEHALAIAEHRA